MTRPLTALLLLIASLGARASQGDDAALSLQLQGVGQLRFGERFEWLLEAAPPADLRRGDGIPRGEVSVRSVTGAVRHVLPEPPAFSRAETGTQCTVIRVRTYAVIRCLRDYVFDLATGAAPVALNVQFNDRLAPPEWLLEMPLPWWRETGSALPGSNLLVLEYGWVNYGQAVEATEILRGPALLELGTGRFAAGYVGDGTQARPYDAEADARAPNAFILEEVVADRSADGRRTVTVLTRFDRCAGAYCASEADPAYRQPVPVTFLFE